MFATAGPGALNIVMGVATAYRDSIPLLVITGDVPTSQRGQKTFQDIDLCSVFKPVTLESFYCHDPHEAILNLKKAIEMLKNGPTGPIHLNLPKDVLESMVNWPLVEYQSADDVQLKTDLSQINEVIKLIKSANKPLIVAGAGVIWSGALKEVEKFVKTTRIPLTTTYHGRGILSEDDPFSLGLIGNRGTPSREFCRCLLRPNFRVGLSFFRADCDRNRIR